MPPSGLLEHKGRNGHIAGAVDEPRDQRRIPAGIQRLQVLQNGVTLLRAAAAAIVQAQAEHPARPKQPQGGIDAAG